MKARTTGCGYPSPNLSTIGSDCYSEFRFKRVGGDMKSGRLSSEQCMWDRCPEEDYKSKPEKL